MPATSPAVRYGFERTLTSTAFDDVITRVTAALSAEGFGVLTDIDVAATLKKKLDVTFRRYRILGACNPALAHRVLGAEPQAGLLLPCNVVVQDAPSGGVTVSIIDAKAMFTFVDNPAVASIASDVDARLRRVMESLG